MYSSTVPTDKDTSGRVYDDLADTVEIVIQCGPTRPLLLANDVSEVVDVSRWKHITSPHGPPAPYGPGENATSPLRCLWIKPCLSDVLPDLPKLSVSHATASFSDVTNQTVNWVRFHLWLWPLEDKHDATANRDAGKFPSFCAQIVE